MGALNTSALVSLLFVGGLLLLNIADADLLRSKFRKYFLTAFRFLAILSVVSIALTGALGYIVHTQHKALLISILHSSPILK